jgi:hypothetical protein
VIFIKRPFEGLSQLPGDHLPGGSTGFPATGFGTSPMMVFSGQMENAGHFAHPTASAMGQSVMMAPLAVKDRAYAVVARLTGTSAGPPEGDGAVGDVRGPACKLAASGA